MTERRHEKRRPGALRRVFRYPTEQGTFVAAPPSVELFLSKSRVPGTWAIRFCCRACRGRGIHPGRPIMKRLLVITAVAAMAAGISIASAQTTMNKDQMGSP